MKKIPVIGIGASAGGLKEFERFFKNMPSSKEVAFVIIQHLSPNYKSILADIVNRYTEMDVCQIENQMAIEAGKVYIIPPNKLVTAANGKLKLLNMKTEKERHLPIDIFFRSLKDSLAEKAVAVILSGTGSDGTLGIKEVKEAGGLTIVQQPDTAEYDGMPVSAIKTGLIDFIIPVEEMPSIILDYIENEFQENKLIKADDKKMVSFINQIFELIKAQTGHDFRNYKRNTIYRRIERRITVNKLSNLKDYIDKLKKDSSEISTLYKELLISVTSFFRDIETFNYIENTVIPKIISNSENNKIRIWIPACATGEEAYSYAILLRRYIDDNKLNIEIQIFASDIDTDAIEKAREGFYTNNIIADVPTELLERFFIEEPDGYRIKKSIREDVIFAEQNLVQDPPYSKLDLISCRNLLIYLDTELQQKAISIFHYSLKHDGILVLGNSESLGNNAQYYKIIDRKFKIFKKVDSLVMENRVWTLNYSKHSNRASAQKISPEPISEVAKDFILDNYTPPSIVIDYEGEMVYAQGRTGKYLEITTGEISSNIIRIAREGLKMPLSNGIRKVKLKNKEVILNNIRLKTDEGYENVDIIIAPLKRNSKDTKLIIITFMLIKGKNKIPSEKDDTIKENTTVYELEKELAEKEQYLQSTIEELETTNEELKSSNEEAQSTNEELQSTNEELETSKEELQSVNEELSTTNNELVLKVDELNKVNNQLKNLLTATEIATIFLDMELRIFNFTPSISIIIDLLQADIGRSIKQFTNNLQYDGLVDDAKEVLRTLIPREVEVETTDNRYFWMRILPYRTIDDKIEGAVITFTDIIEKKKQEAELEKHRNYLEELVAEKSQVIIKEKKLAEENYEKLQFIIDNIPVGITILNKNGDLLFQNSLVSKILHLTKEELIDKKYKKRNYYNSAGEKLEQNQLPSHFAINADKLILNEEIKIQLENGKYIWVSVSAIPVKFSDWKAITVVTDITSRKEIEIELTNRREQLKKSQEIAMLGNYLVDMKNNTWTCSENFSKIFGLPNKEKYSVEEFQALVHPDDFERVMTFYNKCIEEKKPFNIGYRCINQSTGKEIYVKSLSNITYDSEGNPDKTFGIKQDITKQKLHEIELRKHQRFLKKSQEIGKIGTWHMNLTNENITWTEENYKIFEVPNCEKINYDLFLSCVHPDDREFVNKQWSAAKKGKTYDIEHRLLVNDKIKWVREIAEIITNENGDAVEAIGVTQDITNKKKIENEIKEQTKELYELNQSKDKFISILGHDLKNPFNSILGFLALLRQNIGNYSIEEIEEKILFLDNVSKQTFEMLEELLLWSRASTGTIEHQITKINLNDAIENVIELVKHNALSKEIAIDVNLSKATTLNTDLNFLKTVLRNLITNSIKFTKNGGKIIVAAKKERKNISISVEDNGIGMSKEKIDSLFDFTKMQSSKGTNNEVGTGLGLLICKEFIEKLGGEIWVESKINKGTIVHLTIPDIPVTSNKSKKRKPKKKGQYTILIVDDELYNYELLNELLALEFNSECKTIYAQDGVEAVDYCKKNNIDMVFMDIKMPNMDGFEATLKIKKLKPELPIIMNSTGTEQKNIKKSIALGCSEFMNKPIEQAALKTILDKYLVLNNK